ncbi:hypothetical protein Q8F55_005735 [Vanrija albida]|uniref:Phosphatidic acid phosphatase type 2/haloperoxidase domain-containing protein n=1 Tax=Vanrija albida TaxID=181172 RepID=A0ABR3Q2N9_9TREE
MVLPRIHRPSDYPSFLLYFLDQAHATVTAGTAAVILYTRSAHAVWFALGAVASTLMAKVAKKLIREPRPDTPDAVKEKKTYGMPSSHATALSYYFCYLLPLLPLASGATWAERAALTATAGAIIWSRVELGYHTVPQVLGGAVVGAAGAAGWSALWDAVPEIQSGIQAAIDATLRVVWPQ